MIYALVAVISGAVGAWTYRLVIDGLMLAQKKSHESEKEFMWEEMHRLRAQVANLIGKE